MKTLLSLFFLLCSLSAWGDGYSSIRPGTLWLDTSGKPIHAHGFQIFAAPDGYFYWYGENKEHTHLRSNVWTWGIRAYRSSDFYNWEDMGLIIKPDTVNPLSPLHYSQTLDRPHILYNKSTHKWVCWIKSMDTDGFFVVLQADRFEGPYQLIRQFKPEGFGVGDFDMYADQETGKGYVWFERPHWEMICAELTDDYLGTSGKYSEHFVGIRPPLTREAPAHFVRNGRHYMFTSGTTGYVPNQSKVCVFDEYHGEYTDLGCPHINDKYEDSFGSQISSVIRIPDTELYVALADRWLPQLWQTDVPQRTMKNKEKAYINHQPFERDYSTPQVKDKTGMKRTKWDTTDSACYVMLPITFDEHGKPTIEWHDEWRLEDFCLHLPAANTSSLITLDEAGPLAMPDSVAPICAPFDMPQPQIPEIKNNEVEVLMNPNGLSTKHVQHAIDEMAGQGGGKVVVPAGCWPVGRIELRTGVELHLCEGCELHFSGEIKDYLPVVFTRDEGIDVMSLGAFVYANGAENIALTGKGRIVGPPTECEIYQVNKEKALNIELLVESATPVEERIFNGKEHDGAVFLPKSIAPINCRNVLIEGITIDQGLYWNVVPQYCDGVIIRGVTVRSFGHGRTDGIDIDSSRNVLVEYCMLDCQDDCYTMKSGRNEDGRRVNCPTENVVLRRNVALRGAGGIVCGTEIAGGVRNIFMHDCVFNGTDQAFRFKTLRKRGGSVSNIFIERVRARVIGPAFYCDMLGSVKWGGDLARRYGAEGKDDATVEEISAMRTPYTPDFHDITIRDVVIEHCGKFISAIGLPERPLRNVSLLNLEVKASEFGLMRDVDNFKFDNINLNTK